MQNIRKKREEDRIQQLEQEELKKREQDLVMEQEEATRRTEALAKANKHMHDNQDQVKAFHSKM